MQVGHMIVFVLHPIQALRFSIHMQQNLPCCPGSNETLELMAVKFRALSAVSRLKLIMAVQDGEKNEAELMAATGLHQANASKHLKMLTEIGILSRRKHRRNVLYSLCDAVALTLFRTKTDSLYPRRDTA
jgi:DNA-binding transcriptional ArsR family regulator